MKQFSYEKMPFLMLGQTDEAPGAPTGESGTVDPGGTGGAASSPAPGRPGFSPLIWLPVIFVFIFLMWSSSSAQRKEKKKRAAMLSALSRHDRVQTVGGVIGSVVEIKDTEVVLKVDEANNIKMRFARSAIQQVLADKQSVDAGLT